MKVTYLQIHPGPQSGERLEIADIPDGVEWYLCNRASMKYNDDTVYWKEGSVVHYIERTYGGELRQGVNSRWLNSDSPKRYLGQIR